MYYIKNGIPHEEYHDSNHVFFCQCGSPDHHFIITIWDHEPVKTPKNIDDFNKNCYLQVQEKHYQGFFKKLLSLSKYFLGYKVEYNDVMIRFCDIPNIVDLLEKFNKDIIAFADQHNFAITYDYSVSYGDQELVIKDGDRTVVFQRDSFYGEDCPPIVAITVRLPKVSFLKKFKYAWEYLKYDGTYCDIELTMDKISCMMSFLASSVPKNLIRLPKKDFSL